MGIYICIYRESRRGKIDTRVKETQSQLVEDKRRKEKQSFLTQIDFPLLTILTPPAAQTRSSLISSRYDESKKKEESLYEYT